MGLQEVHRNGQLWGGEGEHRRSKICCRYEDDKGVRPSWIPAA
jgi:hypothetical protein